MKSDVNINKSIHMYTDSTEKVVRNMLSEVWDNTFAIESLISMLNETIEGMTLCSRCVDSGSAGDWEYKRDIMEEYCGIIKRVKQAMEKGYSTEDAVRGYCIKSIGDSGIEYVKYIKEVGRFGSDYEAALYAENYDGLPVIDIRDIGITGDILPRMFVGSPESIKYLKGIKGKYEKTFDDNTSYGNAAMALKEQYGRDFDDAVFRHLERCIGEYGLEELISDAVNGNMEKFGVVLTTAGVSKLKTFLNQVYECIRHGWSYTDCVRGWIRSASDVIEGATCIERIDDLALFENDIDAAVYARVVYGVNIIDVELDYGIKPGDEAYAFYEDTPGSREAIRKYISEQGA